VGHFNTPPGALPARRRRREPARDARSEHLSEEGHCSDDDSRQGDHIYQEKSATAVLNVGPLEAQRHEQKAKSNASDARCGVDGLPFGAGHVERAA